MRNLTYLFILIITGIAFSCGNKENQSKELPSTIFRYNESAGITSLDPAFARNLENIWAVNQIFNGLVQMDDKLHVKPCIAKRWEINEDGTEYTFYLRNDVYFHDDSVFANGKGRKVTAQDFVHSFFRIVDPKVASPGAWIFNMIDFSERSNYAGFVAENDTTLKIYLSNPFPPFLGLLTMQYCSVVPHEAVEKYGYEFRNHPVGTGPFKFKTWKEGVKLILEKNPNYFEKDENGKRLPYLDGVAISFIKDEEAEFYEFMQGKLDFVSGREGMAKQEIFTTKGELKKEYQNKIDLIKGDFLNTEYLGILVDENLPIVKESPLRLKAIRQAINYGFDRDKMITFLRKNIGTPAHAGFVPRGLPSFDESKVKGYTYNPEKAKELLFEAGFPNGEGLPQITLSTTAQYLDLCEFIQHQLEEIGFKIKIDVTPAATHRELVAQSKVNFFRKSWVADYPDAENYLALFYSKNFSPKGPNYTHFKNFMFDKYYEQAIKEVNDSVRYELYQKMDKIVIEEAPVVPLYYDVAIRLKQKNVKGLGINPINLLVLKHVQKESPLAKQE